MTEDEEETARISAFLDQVGSYQSRLFDTAAIYNQVIILGGYAAYFTTWSSVSDDLPRWIVHTCGALMIFSISVYVGWTVVSMVATRQHLGRMNEEIARGMENFMARFAAVEAEQLKALHAIAKYWKAAVLLAALPALAAAALLGGATFRIATLLAPVP